MNVIERMRSVVLGEQRALNGLLEDRGLRLERRDPSGATSVLSPYTDLNKAMVSNWSGDDAIKLAYYANVYVYRCVFQCASAIAGLGFRVGKDPEKPDVYDNNSPLAKLLSPPPGGPNPAVSARKLWAWTVSQYIITGKWAWEIECEQPGGNGAVVNLWPLVSSVFNPIPSQGGSGYFTGYAYGKPNGKPSDLVEYNLKQVVYGWRPSQDDYRQPESALMSARLSVSVAVMQDRYDYAFLRNDARPAAIVVHEAFEQDEEKEAFKRAFRADFRGPENAGKALFLEASGSDGSNPVGNALDVKVLGLSQRDAQFIQRYQQKIADICVALGTPLSIIGDSSKRTYDSANVEHRNWWEGTLQPLCYDLQDDVNTQLVPRLNQDEVGWFDFSKVVALQSDSRLLALGAVLPLMVGAGLPITTAEFRDALGLSDIRPDDSVNEAAMAAQKAAMTPAQQQFDQENTPDMTTGADGRPLGTAVGPAAKKGPPNPNPAPAKSAPGPKGGSGSQKGGQLSRRARTVETREMEWREVDAKVRGLESLFEDAMKQIFEKQAQTVLSRLSGRRGRHFDFRKPVPEAIGTPPSNDGNGGKSKITAKPLKPVGVPTPSDLHNLVAQVFDKEYWDQEVANTIKHQYRAIMATTAFAIRDNPSILKRVVHVTSHPDEFKGVPAGWVWPTFDVADPFSAAFINERSNQLAGNVNQTTYNNIQQAIQNGIDEGDDIPEIADRIQEVFLDADTVRALTIARTETISAYNGSQTLIGTTLPDDIVNGQEWLAEVDNRTRETHVEADGQQVAKTDDFLVGGEQMRYPGDPNASAQETVNCRCTVVLLTPDDWDGPGSPPVNMDPSVLNDDDDDDDDDRSYDLETMRDELQWT